MLAADIAGGSFPAVINILLALRGREQSGQGCFIDIAMTDAMFTFAWYALALGEAGGRFPKPGELSLVGGSPRYQLYATKDGKLVACGAIEQKFWLAFTAAIGLPGEFIDDAARRAPRAMRWPNGSRRVAPRNGGRFWPTQIVARPSSSRCRRRCRIRISSNAACLRKNCKRVGRDHDRAAATDCTAIPRNADCEKGAALGGN